MKQNKTDNRPNRKEMFNGSELKSKSSLKYFKV